jgi:Organic Anion Transporter Polypeptide (OATP) family
MKMLGPAVGYSIGSFFLKKYIDPSLTPTINNTDPRWLGAWWAGWAVLGSMLLVLALLISMFPHTMPRTVARRREARARGEKVEKAASSEKATLPGAHFYCTLNCILRVRIFFPGQQKTEWIFAKGFCYFRVIFSHFGA